MEDTVQPTVTEEIIILQSTKILKNAVTCIFVFCLCVLILCMTALPVKAQHSDYTSNDIEKTIEDIINWKKTSLNAEGGYLLSSSLADTAGTANSDWYAFAVGRLGVEDDYFSYLTVLKSYVEEKYKTDEKLDSQKSTEWHRIALTALSLGADPTSFGTDPNGESINLIDDGIFIKKILASRE